MGEDYLRLLASFEVALPLERRSGLVIGAHDFESIGGDDRRNLGASVLTGDERNRNPMIRHNGMQDADGCDRADE
jgi:hypothetical protein